MQVSNPALSTMWEHKIKKMEQELNYLSNKIDELEMEVSYYNREVTKTESEQKRVDINNILERKETELELLQNILNVVTEHVLT